MQTRRGTKRRLRILTIFTYALISMGCLPGCGTFLSLEYQEEYANTVYSGVRLDAALLSGKEPRDGFPVFLIILDLPLSVVGDTAMLCITIPETRRHAKILKDIDHKMLTDSEDIYEVFSLFQGGSVEVYPGTQQRLNIGLSPSLAGNSDERFPVMMRLEVTSTILWTVPLEDTTSPGEYMDLNDLQGANIQIHRVTRRDDAFLITCTITMSDTSSHERQLQLLVTKAVVSASNGDILSLDQIRKLFYGRL